MEEEYEGNIKNQPNSAWQETKHGWSNLFSIIFKVHVSLPTLFSLGFLYISLESSNKQISLLFTILASALLAVAGAIGYDSYKSIIGDSILIKKGKGAVRNLHSIVDKISNASSRTQIDNFSKNEIINLLSLVKKDVVNSIQEWEDVVPGLVEIPYYDTYIGQLKDDLNAATEKLRDSEQLLEHIEEDSKQNREKLEEEIAEYKKTIDSKEIEIRSLQEARDIQFTTSTGLSGTSGSSTATISLIPSLSPSLSPSASPSPSPSAGPSLREAHLVIKERELAQQLARLKALRRNLYNPTIQVKCKECGNLYEKHESDDSVLCNRCQDKHK